MNSSSYHRLVDFLVSHGVKQAIFKPLSENDNSKQQIYLGGSLEALNTLPFRNVYEDNLQGRRNFKASIDFSWINDEGHICIAPSAKLILYPDYPEVRLSGFLTGCPTAPSKNMKPIPAQLRKSFNDPDGRILIFGITGDEKILAYLALSGSELSKSFNELMTERTSHGVFYDLPIRIQNTRNQLIAKLSEIHKKGWHSSCRLHRDGSIRQYTARNGGGYTLEALLGVIPNGKAEPDFLGWEIKAFSSGRITLMTPEPDGGFYGENGVEAFVRKYGHPTDKSELYFTGTHKVDQKNSTTNMTFTLSGFDPVKQKIIDTAGGLYLKDENNEPAAIWTYPRLIEHWGRKHAQAAYIPYEKRIAGICNEYMYNSPIMLGEQTDFTYFLSGLSQGMIVYDPGSKISISGTGKTNVKARSQFRIGIRNTGILYRIFEDVAF